MTETIKMKFCKFCEDHHPLMRRYWAGIGTRRLVCRREVSPDRGKPDKDRQLSEIMQEDINRSGTRKGLLG